jgi:hypothetical protein
MKLGRIIQFALIAAAVLMLAATASASSITFNTNQNPGCGGAFDCTEFYSVTGAIVSGADLVLTSGSGAGTATITLDPQASSLAGSGSNISYGEIQSACTAGCSPSVGGTFGSFSVELFVQDTINSNGTGSLPATLEFIGTSPGGTITSDSSNVTITWQPPTTVGPGTSGGVLSGNLGTTDFTINATTPIVDPVTNGGSTSVQGTVNDTSLPEPATMAMVGGLLIGLAALARKRRA